MRCCELNYKGISQRTMHKGTYTELDLFKSIFGFAVLANKIKAGPNKNITSDAKWFFSGLRYQIKYQLLLVSQ